MEQVREEEILPQIWQKVSPSEIRCVDEDLQEMSRRDPVLAVHLVNDGEVELSAGGEMRIWHTAGETMSRLGGVERGHHSEQPNGITERSYLGLGTRVECSSQPFDILHSHLQIDENHMSRILPGFETPQAFLPDAVPNPLVVDKPSDVTSKRGDNARYRRSRGGIFVLLRA